MDECGFGKGFGGNLTRGVLTDPPFSIVYGAGTFCRGYFGYEDVAIGGLVAKHQQLAVVNYTFWRSDNMSAGLLGLAYPLMTSPDNATLQYDPIFTTFWKQNLTRPMFSLTLSRDQNATKATAKESYLAFGGVPPVDYNDSTWARTPIQPLRSLESWDYLHTRDRGLYVIQPDAFVFSAYNQTTNSTYVNTTVPNYSVIVDVGSTLTYLPARTLLSRPVLCS